MQTNINISVSFFAGIFTSNWTSEWAHIKSSKSIFVAGGRCFASHLLFCCLLPIVVISLPEKSFTLKCSCSLSSAALRMILMEILSEVRRCVSVYFRLRFIQISIKIADAILSVIDWKRAHGIEINWLRWLDDGCDIISLRKQHFACATLPRKSARSHLSPLAVLFVRHHRTSTSFVFICVSSNVTRSNWQQNSPPIKTVCASSVVSRKNCCQRWQMTSARFSGYCCDALIEAKV